MCRLWKINHPIKMSANLKKNKIWLFFKRLFIVFTLLVFLCGFLSWYAITHLMDSKEPRVCFLYTQKYPFPDILFKISAVPLALTSYVVYRKDVFKIDALRWPRVLEAFKKAEFLIIGTHGENGDFLTDDNVWIQPNGEIHPQLKFLYFGSCDIGRKQAQWQRKFPQATLKSVNRLYNPKEGGVYMVFQSSLDLIRMKMTK